VKIRVIEARDLPVMDRSSNLTDAFVDLRFAGQMERTEIKKKTLNPVWKQDFRFNVLDDSELQNEPLSFRVMDHDVYTSDDLIGTVYVSLAPLLRFSRFDDQEDQILGWFPIYDTLSGIRGELHVAVKITFSNDENPFKNSSAGVFFFGTSVLNQNIFTVEFVVGFVEELVVENDPEHEWSDNFRTARKSNESRQSLFYKLSNSVWRQVGKKVLELGGNAVLGYNQTFDIEGDSGLVARGCGTACFITSPFSLPPPIFTPLEDYIKVFPQNSYLHRRVFPRLEHKMSQDSLLHLDTEEEQETETKDFPSLLRKSPGLESEVTLLTLMSMPLNTRFRVGGVVAARSVKFLGRLAAKIADQETRDQWWSELREEIRAHAKSLHCLHVIGYMEDCVVYEDVCILSAIGTAASILPDRPIWSVVQTTGKNMEMTVVELSPSGEQCEITPVIEKYRIDKKSIHNLIRSSSAAPRRHKNKLKGSPDSGDLKRGSSASPLGMDSTPLTSLFGGKPVLPCAILHVPFRHDAAAFANMRVVPCGLCNSKWVPEVVLSTIEVPATLPVISHGVLIEARICRARPKLNSKAENREADALAVSENLVFLEIEMHKQLILKLKLLGMNAAFSLKSKIRVGPRMIIGVTTATAIFTPVLPPPAVLKIHRNIAVEDQEDRDLLEIQNRIETEAAANREKFVGDSLLQTTEYKAVMVAAKNAFRAKKKAVTKILSQRRKKQEMRKRKKHSKRRKHTRKRYPRKHGVVRFNVPDKSSSELLVNEVEVVEMTDSTNKPVDDTSISGFLSRFTSRRKAKGKDENEKLEDIPVEMPLEENVVKETSDTKEASVWQRLRGKGPKRKELTIDAKQDGERILRSRSHSDSSLLSPSNAMSSPSELIVCVDKLEEKAKGPTRKEKNHSKLFSSFSRNRSKSKETSLMKKLRQSDLEKTPNLSEASDVPDDDNEYGGDDEAENIESVASPSVLLEPKKRESARKATRKPRYRSSSTSSDTSGSGSYSSSDSDSSSSSSGSNSSSSSSPSDSSSSSSSSSSNKKGDKPSSSSSSDDEKVELSEINAIEARPKTFVIEVDDETDEDIMAVILDRHPPAGVIFCSSEELPRWFVVEPMKKEQQMSILIRKELNESRMTRLNSQFSKLFHELYAMLSLKLIPFVPCVVCGLHIEISIPQEFTVEVLLSGVVHRVQLPTQADIIMNPIDVHSLTAAMLQSPDISRSVVPSVLEKSIVDSLQSRLFQSIPDEASPDLEFELNELNTPQVISPSEHSDKIRPQSYSRLNNIKNLRKQFTSILSIPRFRRTISSKEERLGVLTAGELDEIAASAYHRESLVVRSNLNIYSPNRIPPHTGIYPWRPVVEISSLSFIPGHVIVSYLGRLNLHFIRETWTVREGGGLSQFFTLFLNEAQAIARSHVLAIGGNALLSFRLTPRESSGRSFKSAYNVISVSGDIVVVDIVKNAETEPTFKFFS